MKKLKRKKTKSYTIPLLLSLLIIFLMIVSVAFILNHKITSQSKAAGLEAAPTIPISLSEINIVKRLINKYTLLYRYQTQPYATDINYMMNDALKSKNDIRDRENSLITSTYEIPITKTDNHEVERPYSHVIFTLTDSYRDGKTKEINILLYIDKSAQIMDIYLPPLPLIDLPTTNITTTSTTQNSFTSVIQKNARKFLLVPFSPEPIWEIYDHRTSDEMENVSDVYNNGSYVVGGIYKTLQNGITYTVTMTADGAVKLSVKGTNL